MRSAEEVPDVVTEWGLNLDNKRMAKNEGRACIL